MIDELFSSARKMVLSSLEKLTSYSLSSNALSRPTGEPDRRFNKFVTTAPSVVQLRMQPGQLVMYRAVYRKDDIHDPCYMVVTHPELSEHAGSGVFCNKEVEEQEYLGPFISPHRISEEENQAKPHLIAYTLTIPYHTPWDIKLGYHQAHANDPKWFEENPYVLFPLSLEEMWAKRDSGLHYMNDYVGLAPCPNVYVDQDGHCWALRRIKRLEELMFFYGDWESARRLAKLGDKALFRSVRDEHREEGGFNN